METWRRILRDGIMPQLSTRGLEALRAALVGDDARLLQGLTITPPPMQSVLDWPPEGACPIGICAWLGEGRNTIGAVEEHFAEVCFGCDQRLGEPAVVRFFLNWWDDTPRAEAIRALLPEVERELASRRVPAARFCEHCPGADEVPCAVCGREAAVAVTQ